MKTSRTVLAPLAFAFFASGSAPAFSDSDFRPFERAVNSFETSVRTTEPRISGTTFSGGSVRVRYTTPVRDVKIQPFNVQPPSINASCSGVDIYLGSFSTFDESVLADVLQQIPAMFPYLAVMALNAIAEDAATYLNNWIEKLNELGQMNLGNCNDWAEGAFDVMADGVSKLRNREQQDDEISGEDGSGDASEVTSRSVKPVGAENPLFDLLESGGFFDSAELADMTLVMNVMGTQVLNVGSGGDGGIETQDVTPITPSENMFGYFDEDGYQPPEMSGKECVGSESDRCIELQESENILGGVTTDKIAEIRELYNIDNPDSLLHRMRFYTPLREDSERSTYSDDEMKLLQIMGNDFTFLLRKMALGEIRVDTELLDTIVFIQFFNNMRESMSNFSESVNDVVAASVEKNGIVAFEANQERLDRFQRKAMTSLGALIDSAEEEADRRFPNFQMIVR